MSASPITSPARYFCGEYLAPPTRSMANLRCYTHLRAQSALTGKPICLRIAVLKPGFGLQKVDFRRIIGDCIFTLIQVGFLPRIQQRNSWVKIWCSREAPRLSGLHCTSTTRVGLCVAIPTSLRLSYLMVMSRSGLCTGLNRATCEFLLTVCFESDRSDICLQSRHDATASQEAPTVKCAYH